MEASQNDVLGRITDERAQVDELATCCPFNLGVGVLGAARIVIVATARGRDEREPEEESKELQALALESHVVDLPMAWSGCRGG